jgi:hypothetical protein
VGETTPGLFGSSVEDLRVAFLAHSTRTRFGALARRFFGEFLSRVLRYFVDKELGNYVGPDRAIRTVADAAEFHRALDLHARQSARIMEDFAAGWYSKHNWDAKGEISRDEAAGFVGQALRKIRCELQHEAALV